jgi:hypothetical protein
VQLKENFLEAVVTLFEDVGRIIIEMLGNLFLPVSITTTVGHYNWVMIQYYNRFLSIHI